MHLTPTASAQGLAAGKYYAKVAAVFLQVPDGSDTTTTPSNASVGPPSPEIEFVVPTFAVVRLQSAGDPSHARPHGFFARPASQAPSTTVKTWKGVPRAVPDATVPTYFHSVTIEWEGVTDGACAARCAARGEELQCGSEPLC